MDEFSQRGAIVRIKLVNFMTYDEVELQPGPSLNMILGPNGTGKSAIVCCIIVGLAGEVSLTGRGGSPADFVNKHKDQAMTEIELYNDIGNNYIINRKILITNRSQHKLEHKSQWKISGKDALKSEVQKLVKDLNVKVDNLCQFLPQDSVTQFVKMNNYELLHNTLKAAGDTKLVDQHHRLVALTEDIKKNDAELATLVKSSEENKVNARRLQAEVQLLDQRKQLMDQKRVCEYKIQFIKYRDADATYKNSRKEVNKITKQLKTTEESVEPYRHAVEQHKAKTSSIQEALTSYDSALRSINRIILEQENNIEGCKEKCQELFADFKSKSDAENQRESQLRLKKQEYESLECRLNEVRDVDCTRQIKLAEQAVSKINDARQEAQKSRLSAEDIMRKCVSELAEITREEEQIRAVKQKKSNLLREKSMDAYKALEWLSKNQNKFPKKIYPPIMCEINVKEARHSSIIENAIPRNEMFSFVCQTTEDLREFTRSVRDAIGIRVNVVLAPSRTVEEFRASQRTDLTNFGVKNYLMDLIDAPDPIVRYLCASCRFHQIPVGDSFTEQQLKALLDRVPQLYVGNMFYQVSRSRYDSAAVTASSQLRPPVLLIYSLDSARLARNAARYKDAQNRRTEAANLRDESLKKEDDLKRKWQENSDTLKSLMKKQDEKKYLQVSLQRVGDAMNRLRTEKIDIEAERTKLNTNIGKVNLKSVKFQENYAKAYEDLSDLKRTYMKNLLFMRCSRQNNMIAERKYKAAQKDTTRLKDELKKLAANCNNLKGALKTIIEETQEKLGFKNFKDGVLSGSLKEKFDAITEDNIQDLSDLRENLAMRCERIYTDSSSAIFQEYQRQNKELKEKTAKIQNLQEVLARYRSECTQIRETWLPELNEVLKVIDDSYRDFMQKLGYGGQVKLHYNADEPENYSQYGVMILVKYRDEEQLIPLSSTRQSGGERSVATMIYMLALQTKTTVPFRCVDEINQGMDKTNERRVFELLVKTADSSSSQYFLVSPKLLPDLSYSNRMRIHIIFNGRGVDKRIKI